MPSQPPAVHVIEQPLKGVVRTISREAQAEPSLISSVNVVPYGPRDGFHRLSQRTGVSIFGTTHSTVPVQGMLPVGFILQPGATLGPGAFTPPAFPLSNFALSGSWALSSGGLALTAGTLPGTASTVVNTPATPGQPSTSTSVLQFNLNWLAGSTAASNFHMLVNVGNVGASIAIFGFMSTFGGHLNAALGTSLSQANIVPFTIDDGVNLTLTAPITITTTVTETGPSTFNGYANITAGTYTNKLTLGSFSFPASLSPVSIQLIGTISCYPNGIYVT